MSDKLPPIPNQSSLMKMMETNDLLKKVRKIEIKTKGLSAHIFSGEYHSAFKGRGMSFSEVRAYSYGDDVRNIDWNVTARANTPFVKVFEEERELTVMLLIDMSGSSFFGTRTQAKNDMIAEICAVLAFSATNNNDKVGVIFFTDTIEKFIIPKKGRSHILLIIRELLNLKPKSKGTNIGEVFQFLNSVIKKRSICFVLSDFNAEGYDDTLRIAAKRHDIVGIRINDPMEEKLPDAGLVQVQDAETGATQWLDTSDKNVRAEYEKNYRAQFQAFKTLFNKTGIDFVNIKTTDNYITALRGFFESRFR
jgi:uncharacterized protein (DUF58 family)